MASSMFSRSSFSVVPWLTHPGSSGTVPTKTPSSSRSTFKWYAWVAILFDIASPPLDPSERALSRRERDLSKGAQRLLHASRPRVRAGPAARGQVGERVGVERALRACRGHRDRRSARRPTERRIEPRGRPDPHHARRATEGSEGTVERSETASLMRGRAADDRDRDKRGGERAGRPRSAQARREGTNSARGNRRRPSD